MTDAEQYRQDMLLGRSCRMEGIRSCYTLGKVLGMLEMYNQGDEAHAAESFLRELADASEAEREKGDD